MADMNGDSELETMDYCDDEEARSLETQAKSPGHGLEHFRGSALAQADFNNKFDDDIDERDMVPSQPET